MSDVRPMLLLPDSVIASSRPGRADLRGHGVAIVGDEIRAVAPQEQLRKDFPTAEVIELTGAVVMPGLINAHQHGRGISSLQLGAADDLLEVYISRSRARLYLDPGLNAALAAARFIASGVTGVMQANTPLGTGDYATELRATLAAYDASGIRAAVAVGLMDRGHVVYPDEALQAFSASLPTELRALAVPPERPIYAGDLTATIGLTEALLVEYGAHPRIVIGYGPAGPQWTSDALLRGIASHASANRLFVHFHGLESLAQVPVVARLYPEGMLARLKTLGLATPRSSIGHAVWMSEADARIAADHGVAFVRNAGSNLRLRAGVAPLAEYLRLGVTMAVGTDNLSLGEEEDLFSELRLAGALARSPFWDGAPSPDAAALFDMVTINGARVAGFARVGVVEPEAKADLIAIRLGGARGVWMSERIPLLDAVVARAHGGDVALTMIDGRIVYRDGRILTLDVDRLRAEAVAALERTEPAVPAEMAERLAAATRRFYGARVDTDALPPHWRPLAFDRRRCH